jgi:hypothetical protein
MPAATIFHKTKNRSTGTLLGGINNVDDPVIVTLNAGEGAFFPAVFPFHITINDEILHVTNRVVDVLTATRADEGTVIAVHVNGSVVQLHTTSQLFSELQVAVNYVEVTGAFIDEAETISAKWTWTLAAGVHIARRIGADAEDRSYWTEEKIAWGTGAVAADTEIGRGGVNLLSTPDDFQLGTTPATAGKIRLPNVQYIQAREQANVFNVILLGLNVSNEIHMEAPIAHRMLGAIGGTVAFSAYVAAEANPKTTIEHGQIQFGAGGASAVDVRLYRAAANVLATPDDLQLGTTPATVGLIRIPNAQYIYARNFAGAADVLLLGLNASNNIAIQAPITHSLAAGTTVIAGHVLGEANPKVQISHLSVSFGAGGAAALDTTLYRSAANVLKTDDALHVALISRLIGRALIGADADPAVSATLELQSTTGALLLNRLTTAQETALTAVDGMLEYNSTIPGVRARVAGAWVSLGAGNVAGPSMGASHIFDEFIGGANTAGDIGELNWLFSGSAGATATPLTGTSGHPGVCRFQTGAVASAWVVAHLGYSVAPIIPGDYFDITLVFRALHSYTAGTARFGLGYSYTDDPPTDGLYLEKKTGDTNWYFTTRSGGVDRTRTDTGVPGVGGSWFKLRIWRKDGATIGFRLDAGGVTDHTVGLPTNPLSPILYIKTSGASAASLEADAMDLYVTGLTR